MAAHVLPRMAVLAVLAVLAVFAAAAASAADAELTVAAGRFLRAPLATLLPAAPLANSSRIVLRGRNAAGAPAWADIAVPANAPENALLVLAAPPPMLHPAELAVVVVRGGAAAPVEVLTYAVDVSVVATSGKRA